MPVTIEQYLEGEKYLEWKREYVAGEIYTMPDVTRRHALIVGNILFALHTHLRNSSHKVFVSNFKLRIGDDFYYPDLFVTCDPKSADPYYSTRPLLIVEVVSPESRDHDSNHKLMAYQSVDCLQEYALVEQDGRDVRVYRRTGATWESATYADPNPVELRSVRLNLPQDQIYHDLKRWE